MKKILIALAILFAFPASAQIPEGAIVKTVNNPDVYIVKYSGGEQYKRLVLNPLVFQSYGHLKWENLLTISDSEMNSFTTSDLVRVDGSTDIYQLVPEGDNGGKYLITSTDGYDLSSIYTINGVDFGNYERRGERGALISAEVQRELAEQEATRIAIENAKAEEARIAEQKAIEFEAYKLTKEYRVELMKPVLAKINLLLAVYLEEIAEHSTKMVALQQQINTYGAGMGITTDGWEIGTKAMRNEFSELEREKMELNVQYDALNAEKLYRIQDYIDYGVIIPAANRAYLSSLGIEINL
ncbi:MAG: hypothetical protein WCY09_09920 [Candidatus Omnitrophota bacterium]